MIPVAFASLALGIAIGLWLAGALRKAPIVRDDYEQTPRELTHEI